MKVLMVFVIRLCGDKRHQYSKQRTQFVQFSGDRTLFFTKLFPHGIHLRKGEVFWFSDGTNPFFPNTPLKEGFHDYEVLESGLLYHDDIPRPYFVILETDYKSEYECGQVEECDWEKHVEDMVQRHKKSFAKFGWKFEEELPQQKCEKVDLAGQIILPKDDDYPLSHLPPQTHIAPSGHSCP